MTDRDSDDEKITYVYDADIPRGLQIVQRSLDESTLRNVFEQKSPTDKIVLEAHLEDRSIGYTKTELPYSLLSLYVLSMCRLEGQTMTTHCTGLTYAVCKRALYSRSQKDHPDNEEDRTNRRYPAHTTCQAWHMTPYQQVERKGIRVIKTNTRSH